MVFRMCRILEEPFMFSCSEREGLSHFLFYFDAVLYLLQTFLTFQRISRTYDLCKWQILAAIPSPGMHI
jgi:hypothetical protein